MESSVNVPVYWRGFTTFAELAENRRIDLGGKQNCTKVLTRICIGGFDTAAVKPLLAESPHREDLGCVLFHRLRVGVRAPHLLGIPPSRP